MTEHKTKDGRPFTIRQPTEDDARNIIDYSRMLFASTDQVLTTLEEYTVTVQQEQTWISNFNDDPNSVLLIAVMQHQIAGLLFFVGGPKKKNAHTGELGVSVHPDFQSCGIGRQLIVSLIQWAQNNPVIEKVFLNVFATNEKAIRLYKNLGFTEEGRFIRAVKQPDGAYVDVLQMYIMTK
ncbi:MAG TPA: GNAT family protein [Puia sp.]|jgi:RimJ/RimL family protein N-acetyltransferase|nr:GNAT family protein [Puia sp.]